MMTQDRDYEDALRRALAAAAESIEPAGDGLQRIRHRLDSRPRSAFSGCAEWLDLQGTRLLVRLDPVIEGARTLLRHTGPLAGPLLALASFLTGLLRPRGRRRAGGHRGHASPPGRLGPAGAWLKPVFAVSVAVVIVMVGVVILNHETGALINPANGSYGPGGTGSGVSSGGTTSNSGRWKLPLGVTNPAQQNTGPASHKSGTTTMLPAVACTPTPGPAAATTAPAGSATATPTATATASETPTGAPPTPTPSATVVPTVTPTASAATGGTSTGTDGTATATAAALVTHYDAGAPAVVECGASPEPSRTP